MEEDIPDADIPLKPKEDSKSSKSQTNKVSMVAAIFRAKKKKQEEERVTDGKKEDVDQNESQKKLDKTELCKMKSTGRDKVPEEKEEKTVISKPSALARVF